MPRAFRPIPWTRLAALGAASLALAILPGCDNGNRTTQIVNQGLDCGLVRTELLPNPTSYWQINVTGGSRTLENCDNGSSASGNAISIAGGIVNYSGINVSGGDQAVTFVVTGDRTDSGGDIVNPELIASVEADSCLAMFRVWDKTNKLFLVCIGTFDRALHTINPAGCDSVEVDTDVNGAIDYACSLSNSIGATADIF